MVWFVLVTLFLDLGWFVIDLLFVLLFLCGFFLVFAVCFYDLSAAVICGNVDGFVLRCCFVTASRFCFMCLVVVLLVIGVLFMLDCFADLRFWLYVFGVINLVWVVITWFGFMLCGFGLL